MTGYEQQFFAVGKVAAHALTEHLTTIDWEQRRYEIAREVMAADVASGRNDTIAGHADYAISMADELIKQLKQNK